jgi:hypothetical protein
VASGEQRRAGRGALGFGRVIQQLEALRSKWCTNLKFGVTDWLADPRDRDLPQFMSIMVRLNRVSFLCGAGATPPGSRVHRDHSGSIRLQGTPTPVIYVAGAENTLDRADKSGWTVVSMKKRPERPVR